MNCPGCGSNKIRVIDVVHNNKRNETYRKKKCTECKNVFYTIEVKANIVPEFLDDWSNNHRAKKTDTKKDSSTFMNMMNKAKGTNKEINLNMNDAIKCITNSKFF